MIFVDGIYLSHKLVVLIACTKTHVLGWYVAKGETTRAWQALMSRIATPDVVVCDGGQGIASAVKTTWPTIRIQRCVFHAYSAVKCKTTTRPALRQVLISTVLLRPCSRSLPLTRQWHG